jgi:hypothetical protein
MSNIDQQISTIEKTPALNDKVLKFKQLIDDLTTKKAIDDLKSIIDHGISPYILKPHSHA